MLDLFAGTGALGLEALSRGAAHLTAVEKAKDVARVLAGNAEACGFGGRVDVLVEPVDAALRRLSGSVPPFDLVFVDPPYRQRLIPEVLHDLLALGLLGEGGRVLAEQARDETGVPSDGYEIEVERRYGDSRLTLLRRAAVVG